MSAADLAQAYERRKRANAAVSAANGDDVERVAEAYRDFVGLLRRYEDIATGTGNFETYVEFQEAVADLVETLPEDLPARDAFEGAAQVLEQRTLRSDHFDGAREALTPAQNLTEDLDEREAAREAYAETYIAVRDRLSDIDEKIADLEALVAQGEADLDAPVGQLEEPIRAYNEAVDDAFTAFRRSASARAVFDLLDAAASYPLVEIQAPPGDLREYVSANPVGEEPIPTILEYADYSRSKLDHYVDDPSTLKRRVATNRRYLEGLATTPLTIEWPPRPATELRWRTREYEAVLHRFADEPVVERLRAVRALTRMDDFPRLRQAAIARVELDPDERARLESGKVQAELEELRAERQRLQAALADHPEP